MQPHLALCLPEILNHIFTFLIPTNLQEETKRKPYSDIYPCLFVNRLWHDNASRLIWRTVCFEDTEPGDFGTFLKFATYFRKDDTLSPCPRPSLSSSSVFASLAISDSVGRSSRSSSISSISSYDIDTPDDTNIPEQQEKNDLTMDPDRNTRLANYRKSLRSLTIRKIKLRSLNEPLAAIGEQATRLEHLDVYICDFFTNGTLLSFIKHQSLTYLSLAGCHLISDESIVQVAQNCPRLEHLDLRACGHVSDRSITAIAMCCSRLRHLNVGRIRDREKITIESIALVAKQTQVSVLGLAGCEIDDECMQIIAKYRATGLERVSVNSCSRISNSTIYALIRHCPNLTVFEMKECNLIDDWGAVAELVHRKVLLTLCEAQTKACHVWANTHGKSLDLKAPQK
ncbi:hypothetical protein G6F70_004655 [Rhizopus microsporus]|uniref:RNI-like protein n=1 Tax=Rhizopus microsporus TaxID=58291 RepID=A0A0A1P606_RHIZD|nr:hypothetical protein G6F71_003487 [Rhizopus microsporus]KAG1199752.1 hypothetical protein G6F70_004655 [Rhizopus microsporus]KAG1210376.1 hypothetical protein G6F69_005542 [Rhizopus microsporus]KAG1232100.1 hypothetical protein G6F67_005274 [Rhizopus microsporus]KAG1264295.1 hypothetical protein G6F68_004451 [Rhizopus microsporus]